MSDRVIYVAFWHRELKELVEFLKRNGFDAGETDRLESLVKAKQEAV